MVLYYSFTKTYDLLAHWDEYITLKLASKKNNKSLNVSIPTLQLDKHTAQMIVFAPKVLCKAIDEMCKFVNGINIKSLVSVKYDVIVNKVKPPTPMI
jgi:hypothetical protein